MTNTHVGPVSYHCSLTFHGTAAKPSEWAAVGRFERTAIGNSIRWISRPKSFDNSVEFRLDNLLTGR